MTAKKKTSVPEDKLRLYERLVDSVEGARYDTDVFRADPAWPPAKEYVAVPDNLLEDTAALAPYLRRSYQYALTLRPKRTKKPER